jgi:MFS family permease
MALAPVATILSTNLYYLVFVNILTGMPVAGTTLLLFNYLLEVCPEQQRTAYISYYNVALSLIGFIAPETGIWLLSVIGMHMSMVTSAVLRLMAGFLFLVVWKVGTRHAARKLTGVKHLPIES